MMSWQSKPFVSIKTFSDWRQQFLEATIEKQRHGWRGWTNSTVLKRWGEELEMLLDEWKSELGKKGDWRKEVKISCAQRIEEEV